jgi:small GTP-binding protein
MDLEDPHSELAPLLSLLETRNERWLEPERRIVLQRTHLDFIVPSGWGAAYALDENGHVAGFKFGTAPIPQELIELLLQFPYLQRLVLFANQRPASDQVPWDIPASIGGLTRLRYAEFSGSIRRIPEEILRLGLSISVGGLAVGENFLKLNKIAHILSPPEQKPTLRAAGDSGDGEPPPSNEYELFLRLSQEQMSDVMAEARILEGIFVRTTELEDPPMEIAARGREAIASYFRDRGAGSVKLNEVKVLLVGSGSSGKTSLVKQITGQHFDPAESQTHGIRITPHALGSKKEGWIKANFWDFGGQEIMHATHQFFLSKRSLYVLVLDGRKEEDAEYWLQHVRSFGGDSPVMIVLNKIDEHPAFELNRRFLTSKYPEIVGFYRISCASGAGISGFRSALHRQLTTAAILQTSWPKAWFR